MSGMYHYHYVAIVWNKEDYGDMHIVKNKSIFGLFSNIIFFDTIKEANEYAKSKGFKNCETVSIFHSRM